MTSIVPDIAAELHRRSELYGLLAATHAAPIRAFIDALLESVQAGGTLFLAGNGGSAAECQHLAAELIVRYRRTRRPLAAVALTTDTSALTACGNDFSFTEVFARQIDALGRAGDALLLLSTSGRSENLLLAADAARRRRVAVFGLLGRDGGPLRSACDQCFVVPADDTAVIQEIHLAVIHLACEAIDGWACASDPQRGS